MKKALPIILLLGVCGVLMAQVVAANADKATLSARVAFLERYIRAPETLTEEEAQSLLARLNRIGTSNSADPATIRMLLSKLLELEAKIGGVVSAESAHSKVGQNAHVYGVVERVFHGVDKSGKPYVSVALRGGFTWVWFNADPSHPLYNISAGAGAVVSGKIGEYQGQPQIVVNNPSQVVTAP